MNRDQEARGSLLLRIAQEVAKSIKPELRLDKKNFDQLFRKTINLFRLKHDLTASEIAGIERRTQQIIGWLRQPNRPATGDELEADRTKADEATGRKPRHQLLLSL